MGKRVLFISHDGLTDPLGGSQILPYMSGLSKLGHQISILSCDKPHRYEANGTTIKQLCEEANIHWHTVKYHNKPPILSTIMDLRSLTSKAIQLHKERPFDIVHCRGYIPSLIGLKMKAKFNVKYIFDMRGFWPDERVDGNVWKLNNPVYRTVYNFFKRKEIEFLEQADSIVSLTYAGKEELESRNNILRKGEINVIPCCVDTKHFDKSRIATDALAELRQKLNLSVEDKVIGYLGSIGTWYMLDEMLDFFKILVEKQPNWKFLFVTTEPKDMILSKLPARKLSPDMFRIESAKRNEVPSYLALMDLGIFFIKPCFSKKASSPVKQGEMMAMGIPVIANSGVGDTEEIIAKYNSGCSISEFTNKAYLEAVSNIAQTVELNKKEILFGANDYFNLENGVMAYSKIYDTLFDSGALKNQTFLA